MPATADTRCFHCGQPVMDAARWTVHIHRDGKDSDEPVCCPACQMVAKAIIASGFDNYYRFRSQPANRPAQTTTDDSGWMVYDDSIWQEQFVRTVEVDGEPWREVGLSVSDIHCAACCWLIEQAIGHFDGASIAVNLATHQALLRWNPATHRLSELLARIGQVGYTALPRRAARAQEQARKEYRTQLLRLGIAGLGMMQAMMFALAIYSGDWNGMEPEQRQLMNVFSLVVCLPVMFYAALPFYRGAWRSLLNFRAGMDVPVSLAVWIAFAASVTAVVIGHGAVYFDSVSMFVFLLLLARFAEARVRQHYIGTESVVLPVSCECFIDARNPSSLMAKPVHHLQTGEMLLLRAGATIPVDGVIVDGNSSVDETSFSGESLPVHKQSGDMVYAGTVNGDGVLTVRVTGTAGQTRLDHLAWLTEVGLSQKPVLTLLADKLASAFTAFVLMLAAASGLFWYQHDVSRALAVVLSVLAVSCPCALSLATPAALAFCCQALRQRGALILTGNTTDRLAAIDTVVFDKTGTLTDGKFTLVATQLLTAQQSESDAAEVAAALERFSGHPLAQAFRQVATDMAVSDVDVQSGKGVAGTIAGQCYRIGSQAFCAELVGEPAPELALHATGNIDNPDGAHRQVQHVFLATTSGWLARFDLADNLRADAQDLVRRLQAQGKALEIASGDSSGMAEYLARELGIAHCLSGASPEQKLAHLRALQQQGHKVMMVGDGINDIPVLALADVSVAMPAASDFAKTKADIVLLRPSLALIHDVFVHAAKTRRIVRENLAWALLYNVLALPLAAAGLVPPWLAALGMSLSSLLVTFNSLRLRNV